MDTKKAIVLGADNNYRDKLETTIKSICYHNRDLKFYIFNEDIPKEWFYLMEKRLEKLNCEILNIEIDAEKVKYFSTPDEHIKYMTYFRYFIAEFVKEDRALYLDCDMVIHGNINPLFQKDFEGNYIIAVPDGWYKNIFNAGMMMVNVHKWKTDNICQNLLELTAEKHQEIYGDQGVLNLLFENKWKKVSPHYNFMVGLDTLNVSLYPNYTPYQSQEVLSKLDFYLDINHNHEIDNIISKVHNLSKPIFAFENTSHDTNNRSQILPSTEPKEMVEAIRQFIGE